MTDEQLECLEGLKNQIREKGYVLNPWFNDHYLLRFCRARQFRLNKVIEMVEKWYEFRQKHNADMVIDQWDVENTKKLLSGY